jgi:predicted O-linked N-acetylglucosamine transferase (SPINDLY family)
MALFDRFLKAPSGPANAIEDATASSRSEAERLLEEGMTLEGRGQSEEALKRYEAAIGLKPGLARAHFNRGNILLDKGDATSALAAYERAITYKPDSAAAHYNMGNAHLRLGNTGEAIAACRQAIALNPDFADAHVGLGIALGKLGEHRDAIASYRQAVQIKPGSAELYHALGRAMMESGEAEEAIASLDAALALDPDDAQAHHSRGITLQDLGRFSEAISSYRRAVEIHPGLMEAHGNLGSALKELGKLDEAIACYGHALKINPASAETHYNLGLVFQEQGKLEQAAACYQRALRIRPDYAPAHNSMGTVSGRLAQHEKALEHFRRAIKSEPDNADGHLNLGIALATIGQSKAAIASFQRALDIRPDSADTHVGLANALKDLGQFEPALSSVCRALELDPDCALAHNNLLFIHNYLADQPAALLLAYTRRFGEMAARLAPAYTKWPNPPHAGRSLRVGFVSGDLRDHPVGYFLEGVLAALASQASGRLEVFVYSNNSGSDETSQRLQAHCTGWHIVQHLSDDAFTRRVRDDAIDILIDLSGHTAHNRLLVFARKPAPVQVSWLGYFATTGLAAIDYFIADPWTLPPEQEINFSEQIWRLPETRLCFTAPAEDVAVGPLPALANGYVTFGSFNNLSKMNDAVVALWAQVLNAVPDSRLFLKYQQLGEASVRQSTHERFAAHGIKPERLILEGYVPRSNYLATYQRVDIGLDPFPFPGGTTTAEALWMGIPVLTLAGERFLSRQGVGMLMNAGLPDWIATNTGDYLARAVSHAGDVQRLAVLRNSLRKQVLDSPVFDAPRFAQHFEAALLGMWHKWCSENAGTPPPA